MCKKKSVEKKCGGGFNFLFWGAKKPLGGGGGDGEEYKKCLKVSCRQCYYPHRSRDSLSPICGIFLTCYYFGILAPRIKTLSILGAVIFGYFLYSKLPFKQCFFIVCSLLGTVLVQPNIKNINICYWKSLQGKVG